MNFNLKMLTFSAIGTSHGKVPNKGVYFDKYSTDGFKILHNLVWDMQD